MSDDILAAIEQEFLLPRPAIENPQLSSAQQLVQKEYQLNEFMSLPQPWLGTSLAISRDPVTGEYRGAVEVDKAISVDPMSIMRAAGRRENYATGSSSQIPFQPGGIDARATAGYNGAEEQEKDVLELCTVPDGFERGLNFDGAQVNSSQKAEALVPGLLDAADLAIEYYGAADGRQGEADAVLPDTDPVADDQDSEQREIDKLASVAAPIGQPNGAEDPEHRKEWAHMVDVAAGFPNFRRLVPHLAREFPFELDVFQKRAVYHLERGDYVFVAAHTSAGKTVVAEYAVALSQMHMTKTIYTSPIKALSNQKFNDFTHAFGEDNVGILTGDVKIRPEAPCLIMTTEILKNMLYRGADVLRDVEFVVFDECHYVNDLERGVVWEEVIIMLPRHISIILLSATVPNTKEFAEWVGRTKKRDIYVINTSKRPVPLEHYLYVGRNAISDKDMFKVVDQNGVLNSNEWRDAYNAVNKTPAATARPGAGSAGGAGSGSGRGGSRQAAAAAGGGRNSLNTIGRHTVERQGVTMWVHLIGLLRKQALLPAVIFSFSRKKCEEYANSLRNLDFLNESKRSEVHIFVERCLKRLKPEDRTLPQVQAMRALLRRGIGVHHSGLLPIIKEIVELLFARGLICCLFATETFAMGVNMPARCVVFSSLKKHDGRSFRELLPGEYTQMAGRAGRRGLDQTGVVIINATKEVPDTATLHSMILGPATKLESQFRLTYTMILNLLRANQLRVEEIIKRSFAENTAQGQAPEHERRLLEAKKQLDDYPPLECSVCSHDLAAFYGIASSVQRLTERLNSRAAHRSPSEKGSAAAAQAFAPGRLVLISYFPHLVLGIVVKKLAADGSRFACLVINPPDAVAASNEFLRLAPPYPIADLGAVLGHLSDAKVFSYAYRSVATSSIAYVLSATIKIAALENVSRLQPNPKKPLDMPESLVAAVISEIETLRSGQEAQQIGYPWQRIRELDIQELVYERARLTESSVGFQCCSCPDFLSHYLHAYRQARLQSEVDNMAMQLSDQNLDLLPDYQLRLDVLKDLGYVDEMGNVQLKGRVACEMNSADELVLTELVLDNILATYEPEEIVALLSAFVCTEKNEPEDLLDRLPPGLRKGREKVLEAARRVGSVQLAYGLPVSIEEYEREFRFGLMEVAYEWARGLSFVNIAALTDTQEGIIVRCILRIADVLNNVSTAAVLVGDMELKLKLQAASELIRRDIVFAASLYF
ncbi:Antiviral helicase ski2 [Coemansia asiatica]|uniref:Antiviral helicase ski2 n=1 Tax=Coemansia asiatica TaxID=1052880 RepID=A0A9W7XQC5_9FUNG|nr:Antiviral helicase ski2 [Coemansia asiatica]KAJ2889014.1 Antiviral helicase ski2 [Coemansia asiatica]